MNKLEQDILSAAGPFNNRSLPTGWSWRESPSHGWLIPSYEHNQNVPSFMRANEYEEDCQWSIPVICNAKYFTPEYVKSALSTFMDWYPKEAEQYLGRSLEKGESGTKDRDFYTINENIGKRVCGAAYGDWHDLVPAGKVGAYTYLVAPVTDYVLPWKRKEQDERFFLFDKADFTSQMYFDPAIVPHIEIDFRQLVEKYAI